MKSTSRVVKYSCRDVSGCNRKHLWIDFILGNHNTIDYAVKYRKFLIICRFRTKNGQQMGLKFGNIVRNITN